MAADTKTLRVVVVGDSTQAQRAIRDVGKSAEDTEKRAKGFHSSLGSLKNLLGAGLALGGIGAIGSFFSDSIKGAAEAARGTKVLHNQIKNLGPAGQAAFKDAEKFAREFGGAIGVDDDNIKAVQAKLASFPDAFKKGSLGAEGMERSVKAAFDLQAIGIGSAEANIVGLGKAMNDPIKGMNALAKSGVSFSKSQKDTVKALIEGGDANALVAMGAIANTKVFADQVKAAKGNVQAVVASYKNDMNPVEQKRLDMLSEGGHLMEAQKVLLGGIESNAKGAALAGVDPMQKMKVAIADAGESVAGLLLPKLSEFANIVVTKILPKVMALAEQLGPKIGAALNAAGAALGFLFGLLGNPVVQTFAVAILAIVGAMQAYSLYTTIVGAATKAWTAIQVAFNTVMAMNPIGLVVLAIVALVAGVIYAYTHFEGFRDVVQTVWEAIKSASQAVASWFMTWVWPTFKAVFEGVSGAVRLLATAFSVAFTAVQAAVNAVVSFFKTYVWPTLKFIFDLIVDAVKLIYNGFKFYFGLVETIVRAVVGVFMTYVWPTLKTAFGFIVGIVEGLWNTFSSVFGWIQDKVSAVVGWVRSTAWPIIQAAFGLISDAVSAVWNVWKTVFDNIRSKVETVMDAAKLAFSKAKDAIGDVWGKLQDIAKKPVNFIIETVYNRGIRAFWNAIASKVGAKELNEIHLAGGREIPSVPGIVGDWVPFYGQAGEYVLNRRQMAKAGGRVGIESMFGPGDRSGASSGHYAGGGILGGLGNAWDWVKENGTSLVKGSLLKIAEPLINSIKDGIKMIPGTGDIADAVRTMPTKALDSILDWLRPKDKAPADGGGGAAGPIGAIGQIPAWVTAARDASSFGSNSGVGLWLYNVVKAAGLASSNQGIFNPRRTATGNLSMHGYGRAVDLPASMEIFNFLRQNYGSHMKELIYSPAGGFQVYNGKNHMYSGITRDMHFNHVHASYDEGGMLPPGTTIAHNNTGRNEYVMTGDQLAGSNVTVNVTVEGNVTAERDLADSIATAVRDALLRKAARNGGRTGL